MTKLQKAQAEVKRLWNLMCAADGIDPHSKFVVFSNTNKYAVKYNNACKRFFIARSLAVR